MRVAREKDNILEGKNVKSENRTSISPEKEATKLFSFGGDPTSGAAPPTKKKMGAKKEIPKNTLSFRLLIKTLCDLGPEDLQLCFFREMIKPISFDAEDLGSALRSFYECIPAFVPQFKDEGEIPDIHLKVIKFLRNPDCTIFFGYLLNYGYWNVIHPVARAVLKDCKLARPDIFTSTTSALPASRKPTLQSRNREDDDSSVTSAGSSSTATTSIGCVYGDICDVLLCIDSIVM